MVKDQIHQAREYLANQAATRYQQHLPEIQRVKSLIESNRHGTTELMDISRDDQRKKLRVARVESSAALERVNGVPNFQDIAIIKRITQLSECVCRIVSGSPYGATSYGTGFLVSENLLLTNNHVLPHRESAQNATAQFKYEISPTGHKLEPVNFKLRPDVFFVTSNYLKSNQDPSSGLDFTLVGIEELNSQSAGLEQFGYARLDAGIGKVLEGESCVVIQHPKGDYKKIVLKDIRMISLTDDFLIYESDTQPGSSGSLVAGLGTAEIIALHHSAVPKMDPQGNWLKKDGSIATNSDPDSAIDWIGNEGVRISRIIKMIRALEVPENMRPVKQNFLNSVKGNVSSDSGPAIITTNTDSMTPPAMPTTSNQPQTTTVHSSEQETVGYFEIQLVSNPTLEKDWEENVSSLVPGFVEMEQLFDEHTDGNDPKLYYLTCKTAENPWVTAEKIEKLVHVHYCAPDLPLPTDGMRSAETGAETYDRGAVESAIYSRGYAKPNESRFISKWRYSRWVMDKLKKPDHPKLDEIRRWNWDAVNLNKPIDQLGHWNAIEPHLEDLKLVQLDTGYSNLSKVAGGFDLQRDYDFIDLDHTAKDELRKYFMKHPYHGTRTASIMIGGKLKDPHSKIDGNRGILTKEDKKSETIDPLLKVIPYRVANSVILIGRSRHILAAVEHAVRNQADVMFMCMGSLPTPGLDMAARVAYEHGIIWLCAAGNEVEFVVAPASFPGTIAVAATNPNDEPWDGSSYGEMVDIAAPGERVYVPFIDKHRNEIMVYGDGTSYATPHVAAAAALWKCRWKKEIKAKYHRPWQIIEAFRTCLCKSARKDTIHGNWEPGTYGDGILDIQELLDQTLPSADSLVHAYQGQDRPVLAQSSTTQAFHVLWQGLVRKINPWEPKPYEGYNELTDGGREALSVLQRAVQPEGLDTLEGTAVSGDKMAIDIFRQFAEQYTRNVP